MGGTYTPPQNTTPYDYSVQSRPRLDTCASRSQNGTQCHGCSSVPLVPTSLSRVSFRFANNPCFLWYLSRVLSVNSLLHQRQDSGHSHPTALAPPLDVGKLRLMAGVREDRPGTRVPDHCASNVWPAWVIEGSCLPLPPPR